MAAASSITRTKATYAVDGFNGAVSYGANDRYALDGHRLINIEGGYGQPGALYYTELQTWDHVRAGASVDAGFIVTKKSGEIWEYGQTADSRVVAAGGTAIREWALNAKVDLNGNRIEYSYTQSPVAGDPDGGPESGAYYLARIAYTIRDDTTATWFVDFTYETRSDHIVSYLGGYPVTTAYRLQQISVSLASGEVVRSYTLHYRTSSATQWSCVDTITESGASSAGTPALPPTQIAWQDVTEPGFDIGPSSNLDQQANQLGIQAMDVSGNGCTDIVQLWLDEDNRINATTYLATSGADGISFDKAADSLLGSYPQTREIFPADVDGNGRTDLVVAYKASASETIHLDVYLANTSGGFDSAGTFETGDSWPSAHIQFFAVDANGDGRTDLVEAYGHYDSNAGTLLYFRTYLSMFGSGCNQMYTSSIVSPTNDPADLPTGALLAFWPLDVNGDGMMDVVRVWKRSSDSHVIATAYVSVSTAIDAVSFASTVDSVLGTFDLADQIAFMPVDVDGNGTQDLLQIWQEPGSGGTTLHLTTFLCDGAGSFVQGPDSAFADQTIDPGGFYPMGFTGEGLASLLSRWTTGSSILEFTVFKASQSGTFQNYTTFHAGSAIPNAEFFAGDVNGDGKADLIRISAGTNKEPVLVPYTSTGPYPDLVSSITNPLGGVVALTYAPLTDSTVYDPSDAPAFPRGAGLRYPNPLTPAQFPVQAVLGQAIYVVSKYAESNDPAVNRFAYATDNTLSYGGASINLLGRGWEGFETITKLDHKNGRKTILSFNQAYPLTGTVAATTIEADGQYATDPRVPKTENSLLMSVDSSAYQSVIRTTGVNASQPVIEVLRICARLDRYNYGADQFDYAIGQTFAYDEYGNQNEHAYLGYIDRTTGKPLNPVEVVYRYYSYQNDLLQDGWALGYLRYAKVSANATDADITQFLSGDYHLEQRTYFTSTYNLETTGRWDDQHNQYLTTSYGYDAYGNRTSDTQPGGFVTQHDYDPDYHAFLMQTTSPDNVDGVPFVTTFGYDPRFGIEVARIDANQQVFVTALDAFGRKATYQGPVPDVPGAQSDTNIVTSLVTGTTAIKQAFQEAAVVTLEILTYLDDSQGGLYTQVSALQGFPVDVGRDFLWTQTFIDGLALKRATVRQTGQSAGNAVVLTDYDSDGHPTSQSLPFFSATSVAPPAPHTIIRAYDVLGRPLTQQEPAGSDGDAVSITSWAFGAGGLLTVTSAAGSDAAYEQVQQHHYYDGKDKVASSTVTADGNATTVFVYDAIARLRSATDPTTSSNPQGVSNSITYDSLGRRRTFDSPDQNTTGDPHVTAAGFTYDPTTGLLQAQTDAAGLTTNCTYDNLGRVTTKALGDGRIIAYHYDDGVNGRGYPATVTMQATDKTVESQYEYGYDRYGNVSTTTLDIAGEAVSFVTNSTFDPQRRLVNQVSPSGMVLKRTYNGGALVTQVLGDAQVNYPLEQYSPLGTAGQMIYGQRSSPGSQIATNYTFNPAGLVYHETTTVKDSTILQFDFQYDLLSQLLEITDKLDSSQSQSFNYLNKRLQTAVVPGFATGTGSYKYDASGNLMSKDGLDYTYQAHFPASMKNGTAEVYSAAQDACGRTKTRTANGTTLTFYYDGLGCLLKLTNLTGEAVRDILSDYQGRRLRETHADGTVVLFISPTYQATRPGMGSPSVTESVVDEHGVAASIITGQGAGILYFRRDHKGSTTLTFGADGTVMSRACYSGYGQYLLLSGPDNFLPKYEQRQWDGDIGLYYFGARHYDPLTGRFLTPDTRIGGALLQADALNRFAFECNNPVNFADPTGHNAEWLVGLGLGLAAIGIGAAIILTGGAAAPLAGVATAALLGAGLNAIVYSATHRDTSAGRFWTGFVVNVGVGAVLGAAAGVASLGLGALAEVATAPLTASVGDTVPSISARLLLGIVRAGIYVPGGAVIGAASDTANQFMSNVVDNYIVGKNTGLTEGLLRAMVIGAGFGAVAGGLQAGVEAINFKSTRGTSPGHQEMRAPANEESALLSNPNESGASFERGQWTGIESSWKTRLYLLLVTEGSAGVDAIVEAWLPSLWK